MTGADPWSELIDKHPYIALMVIFSIVLVYEGLVNGLWIITLEIFIISFISSLLLSIFLKVIFKENRGFPIRKIMDYRRPSAHTLIATTLSIVAFLMDFKLFILLLLIPATGLARLKIGAHTKKEVIEGFIYGLIFGVVLYAIFSHSLI